MHIEEMVWNNINPQNMWVLDKLILSRYLNYKCGPTGTDVPVPGWYCVRPCVNAFGMGLHTQKLYIEKSTDHLPIGHFWCEWFDGRHFSVDYEHCKQKFCAEGFKKDSEFVKWDKWIKVKNKIPLPFLVYDNFYHMKWINCEFIGNKLIEVHFRYNTDFRWGNDEYIPVWDKNDTISIPSGYRYVEDPESIVGRIGAFIK
jgi:hypothetical protein